jgi:hypothetical protein
MLTWSQSESFSFTPTASMKTRLDCCREMTHLGLHSVLAHLIQIRTHTHTTITAKSRLLSTMSRKHLMEHVVPVVVSLKHVLEAGHSPLLRELIGYLRELLKSYKVLTCC